MPPASRSASTASRRALTDAEQADAQRLNKVYDQVKAAKKADGIEFNQAILGETIGWSGQSAISQYMTGRIALNLDAAIRISEGLGVPLRSISPRFADLVSRIKDSDIEDDRRVTLLKRPVIHSLEFRDWLRREKNFYARREWLVVDDGETVGEDSFALVMEGISMTNPHSPWSLNQGDLLLIDPSQKPESNGLAFVEIKRPDRKAFYTVRMLIREGGEEFLLALNPDWPEHRMISLPSENVSVCGRVMGRYQKLTMNPYAF